MEGESLIPKKQSNEKIDVDLSDYKSQIQSLKEEIQSLREELQSFKNMDITPEGIEELQSQLQ
jgi:predicted  nucleic acid-binding Zn-ribbon protein